MIPMILSVYVPSIFSDCAKFTTKRSFAARPVKQMKVLEQRGQDELWAMLKHQEESSNVGFALLLLPGHAVLTCRHQNQLASQFSTTTLKYTMVIYSFRGLPRPAH